MSGEGLIDFAVRLQNDSGKKERELFMQYANLHLHSTYSDAGFTPEQLVRIGKALGYGALALTDHETDGGCKRFMRACEQEGIRSVTGAEFYARIGKHYIHLTALDFDQNDPGIRAYIKQHCDEQAAMTRKRFEIAIEKGFIEGITWDDVEYYSGEGAWLCIDSVFNTLYLKKAMPEQGESYVRANWKTIDVGALKPQRPSPEEVINVVRKAGGVVALAHPRPEMTEFIDQLVDWGLNGIEVNHPNIPPEAQPIAEEAAKTYNLYRCGGTDHTGPMSCNGGKAAVPAFHGISEEDFDILVERRLG